MDVYEKNQWTVLSLSERVDSFNCQRLKESLQSVVNSGKKQVAVDMSSSRFLSLPAIKFLSEAAEELHKKEGRVALFGLSEKLKRQIDIYASLDHMQIYRTSSEWEKDFGQGNS